MSIVRDVLSRAEAIADGGDIAALRLRVGVLAGVDPGYLREYIDREATQRWGHSPKVEIEESDDPTDPNALGVVLVGLGV